MSVLKSPSHGPIPSTHLQDDRWKPLSSHTREDTYQFKGNTMSSIQTSIERPLRLSLHTHKLTSSSHDASLSVQQHRELERLCDAGLLEKALNALISIKTSLPENLYISLLKLCNKSKTLIHAKRVYVHVTEHSLEHTCLLSDHLVVTLAVCGAIEDALQVFVELSHKTVVSWTALISAYTDRGQAQMALEMYACMEKDAIEPNHYTFVSLFKACGIVGDVKNGTKLHADAVKVGLSSDVFVGNTLVSMYGKFGAIMEAENLFTALSYRNLVSWNAMLSSYAEQHLTEKVLLLFRQMQEEKVIPNQRTFSIVLQACSILGEKEEGFSPLGLPKPAIRELGVTLHADAKRNGFDSDVIVGTALVCMYSKCGNVLDTENAFGALSQHDAVSWMAMQSAYIFQGEESKAIQLYVQMQREGVSPNQQAYVIALHACAILAEKERLNTSVGCLHVMSLAIGKALHACALTDRYVRSLLAVENALVTLLGKCGAVVEAEAVFCAMYERDIVSWNAMLSAYVEQGQGEKALQLYKLMTEENVKPDERTFVIALKACGVLAAKEHTISFNVQSAKEISWEIGVVIHADASEEGFENNLLLGNTLVRMYGKWGMILKAEEVFWGLVKRDIVSWNALLSTCVEQGRGEKALLLYKQMQGEDVYLTDVTFMCILQACSDMGSLEMCKYIHFSIISARKELDPSLAASLIHAYGSCGTMVDAKAILERLPEPDMVAWNACIDGYAGVGEFEACVKMLKEMQFIGIKPDEVTFSSILSACSHGGLIHKGFQYFESMMIEDGISPDLIHFSSMVNLLGRAGDFKGVSNILESMSMQADLTLWSNLLLACGIHGNVELGKVVFDHAVTMHPKDSAAFIFMSNFCADIGLPQTLVRGQ